MTEQEIDKYRKNYNQLVNDVPKRENLNTPEAVVRIIDDKVTLRQTKFYIATNVENQQKDSRQWYDPARSDEVINLCMRVAEYSKGQRE